MLRNIIGEQITLPTEAITNIGGTDRGAVPPLGESRMDDTTTAESIGTNTEKSLCQCACRHTNTVSRVTPLLTIDRIIKTAREGKRVLALVDELARTTNPDEGKRMVNGFIRICRKLLLTAIVTTHYSGLEVECKRLRVKGLQIPQGISSLNIGHISDYMDYTLIETCNDDVPKEAFTIARLLHVDDDFLEECESAE